MRIRRPLLLVAVVLAHGAAARAQTGAGARDDPKHVSCEAVRRLLALAAAKRKP
jgi:hypothetical protein